MRNLSAVVSRAAALLVVGGCALYSDVSIGPLYVLPTKLARGADVSDMVAKSDYLRALEMRPTIEAKQRPTAAELAALGRAELAAGRYDLARHHLRQAIELRPGREAYRDIAWSLSQLEYMQNDYDTSLEWARLAMDSGLTVKQWHLDFLTALRNVEVYRVEGATTDRIPLRMGRPDVPRTEARVNRARTIPAVIDSGAVLSILSERFAASIPLQRLGNFKGTFYGLLGEPIAVDFALLDTLELGDIVVRNVPVAIMPDEKMRFVVSGANEYRIDFLLGANLLKEFRIELRFGHQDVRFTKLRAADRVADPQQNLFMHTFRPVVRGTVNKQGWYMFVLDTGSEVTFLNENHLMNLPIDSFAPRMHNATLQGLGGAKKRGAKIENVEIGVDKWAGTFKTLPMYTSGEGENASGIIGQNFLKNFNVTIDFGRMRVELERR